MSRERFVLLGLARARSVWFRSVAQWTTSAALPADFVKCVSAEELRVQLSTGRAFSAALLDGGLPAVDRDLLAAVREAAAVPFVVDDGRARRDWAALGAAAVLPADLDRDTLLDALATHAAMVGGGDAAVGRRHERQGIPAREGRVVTVCGAGGTGVSTAAVALAQHIGAEPRGQGPVLLADLALRAEQAMLHDARDIVPGVQELVDAHRGRHPSTEEVTALTFDVAGRGYRLLLGLRRTRYWATLRPRAFEAAFESLRRTFGTIVCDVTGDLEGEDQGGSVDVEERNMMARTAVLRADAVVVVGTPGVKGLHAMVRVLGDLVDVGVPGSRLVPVVNLAPRNPRARAEITAALAQLSPVPKSGSVASPVFVPRVRRLEEALRDGVPLPAPIGPLLAGAVRATLSRTPRSPVAADEPQPVVPGSLGTFSAEPS